MRKILLTGGTGFIGSHTCIELLKSGFEIVILDSFFNSSKVVEERLRSLFFYETNLLNINLSVFKGDIRDFKFLDYVFRTAKNNGHNIDGVIHFAGLKSVNKSIKDPTLYWEVNVSGTINLLEVMSKNSCHTFVFSSSATVYSFNELSPLNEKSNLGPNNPYGETKLAVENILKDLKKN